MRAREKGVNKKKSVNTFHRSCFFTLTRLKKYDLPTTIRSRRTFDREIKGHMTCGEGERSVRGRENKKERMKGEMKKKRGRKREESKRGKKVREEERMREQERTNKRNGMNDRLENKRMEIGKR